MPSVNVTVIIVNWNGGILLKSCLSALDKQTLKPAAIYLMDNGSTDGSLDLIPDMPGLKIYKLEKNYGFAVANNKAIADCETDYVALLNPDAIAEPDWLENLVSEAEKRPDFAVFGSRQMMLSDKDMLDGVGDVYHMSGLAWRKGYGRKIRPDDFINRPIFGACACAALYRTSALKELHGFDEDYFCYFEDTDLGFRFNLAGYKAMAVLNAVVNHSGSASTGGQNSNFSVYHGHRNLVWTYIKDMPGFLFWILLPLHLLLNIYSLFYFAKKGKGKVILKAKWDAIKGIPKMLVKRRTIQKVRRASTLDIWRILYKNLIPTRKD